MTRRSQSKTDNVAPFRLGGPPNATSVSALETAGGNSRVPP
jgi:hypothetical protein